MLVAIAAIEGIVVLIGFFYLIHLVSHQRNIMRQQIYMELLDYVDADTRFPTENDLKEWQRMGIVDKKQAYWLGEVARKEEQGDE